MVHLQEVYNVLIMKQKPKYVACSAQMGSDKLNVGSDKPMLGSDKLTARQI